jgi:thioredoxin reductase
MAEDRHVRVLVVGGGPSGLAAATGLAPSGEVVVLEREAQAGGIPRHSDHTGYGLRDMKRVVTGPNYARHWRRRAVDAGAEVLESAMATDWADERTLWVTSPDGRYRISADAVVLATGARERPRSARRIPGDRPAGVLTTGQLQNLVHVHHQKAGRRAVVVGAELVSWSAVLTLREAGCRTVAMTSRYEKSESYAAFRFAGRLVLRTPVRTRTELVRIDGRDRVEAVVVRDLGNGQESLIECDTVVMTGDWIPDNELARSAGIELDPSTLGPAVDSALRTDVPGVFAVGNLLHPVDTADVASQDGTHVVPGVVDWLANGTVRGGTRVTTDTSLRWVTPQYVEPGGAGPARDRLLTWCDEFVSFPVVEVRQGEVVVSRHRVPWPAAPGRVFRIPSSVLRDVDVTRGPVELGLRGRGGRT